MTTKIFAIGTILVIFHISLAMGADPNIRQIQPRQMPSKPGSTTPQMELTPDFLYQQITSLKQQNSSLNKQNNSLNQQIKMLTGQVNALLSVVQISQNGTTIQAENLSLTAGKALTLLSGKKTSLTAGEDLDLQSGKTLSLKGGKDLTAEGEAHLKLKAPQIKLNDGTKAVAHVTSSVAGGKVISGTTSVFVP